MLAILDLFSPAAPLWKAEAVAATSGCSAATAYRYLAELCRAGLLTRSNGEYALGGRIVELDYTIRASDPLRQAALPIMRELRDRTGCDALLVGMTGDRIIASHHERGNDPAAVSFGRGRPMPLFKGAGSKAIMAALPTAHVRRLYATRQTEAAEGGLGERWDEVRASLAAIRRAGYAISLGELDPQNAALGAPVPHHNGSLPGGLILVLSRARWDIVDKATVAAMVQTAAARIAAVAQAGPDAIGSIIELPRKRA